MIYFARKQDCEACASVVQMEPRTSSCSPPPPKTSGNWRSSCPFRRQSSPREAEHQALPRSQPPPTHIAVA